MKRHRFSRRNQPVKCRMCGKLTTSDHLGVVALDLCRACNEQALTENSHYDGSHEERPEASCPLCNRLRGNPKAEEKA